MSTLMQSVAFCSLSSTQIALQFVNNVFACDVPSVVYVQESSDDALLRNAMNISLCHLKSESQSFGDGKSYGL
jgi:hypothetical protein